GCGVAHRQRFLTAVAKLLDRERDILPADSRNAQAAKQLPNSNAVLLIGLQVAQDCDGGSSLGVECDCHETEITHEWPDLAGSHERCKRVAPAAGGVGEHLTTEGELAVHFGRGDRYRHRQRIGSSAVACLAGGRCRRRRGLCRERKRGKRHRRGQREYAAHNTREDHQLFPVSESDTGTERAPSGTLPDLATNVWSSNFVCTAASPGD